MSKGKYIDIELLTELELVEVEIDKPSKIIRDYSILEEKLDIILEKRRNRKKKSASNYNN